MVRIESGCYWNMDNGGMIPPFHGRPQLVKSAARYQVHRCDCGPLFSVRHACCRAPGRGMPVSPRGTCSPGSLLGLLASNLRLRPGFTCRDLKDRNKAVGFSFSPFKKRKVQGLRETSLEGCALQSWPNCLNPCRPWRCQDWWECQESSRRTHQRCAR